jgi:hypothetical protein
MSEVPLDASSPPRLNPSAQRAGTGQSIQEQLLRRIVKRFRGGLVFKAHRLLFHSTLGPRVIKKKKTYGAVHDAVAH